MGVADIAVVTLVRENQQSFGIKDERECDSNHKDEVWENPVCQGVSEPGTVRELLKWIGALSVDQNHEDDADSPQEV